MPEQQDKLYAAERTVDVGRAIEDLQTYVDELRESPYWQRLHAAVLHIEARVVPSGRGSVGAWHGDGCGQIEMSTSHLRERIVLHEVSHVLAEARYGSQSHDPWFARTYLELVYTYMGSDAYQALRAAFVAGGIDFDA